jgi:N-acetylneuraminic acid mutarotase
MFELHQSRHDIMATLAFAVMGWMSAAALPVYSQARPGSSSEGGLTLEDRIGYQRAVEEVYWRHRIWPEQNAGPKPNLEEVMPEESIRAKVEDYLLKSLALEVYWQRPITGEQLQAEMDRMARETKQPAILRGLWAAFGNDPYVIAECLARPVLANRFIRNWYAQDERYHGDLKRRAETDLRAYGSASEMRAMSGEYHEVEWLKGEGQEPANRDAVFLSEAKNRAVTLSPAQWEARVRELVRAFHSSSPAPLPEGEDSPLFVLNLLLPSALGRRWSDDAGRGEAAGPADVRSKLDLVPLGELSRLQDDERFYVTAVLEKGNERLKFATVEWKKEPFDTWWGRVRKQIENQSAAPEYGYRLPPIASSADPCADDTWIPTPVPPRARLGHTAVWSGSEMIVWGGYDGFIYLSAGARYNPATDTWTPTATANAPSARLDHTAVWTGSEMIVWGGDGCCPSTFFNTGARYNPATDAWATTATDNAPDARAFHAAVWTGSQMIVWGGLPTNNTGARYDPATDTWTTTGTTNAPDARYLHTAVWTGGEMVVWGGWNSALLLNTGGRYDPATDAWRATATDNAPSERAFHTAVWTGREMIVWGGEGCCPSTFFNTGGRYDPATDTWAPTTTNNAPSARMLHTAVWTGSRMVVWGGFVSGTGGRYDPATDSWAATSTTNAPEARFFHTAVWTGSEMIVWGGGCCPISLFNSGGRYNPSTDAWTPTATGSNTPGGRSGHTAVWTGTEMIVWGGSPTTNTGGRYNPSTNTWRPTSTINAPSARADHTAVWTGTEMTVWGGFDGVLRLNTGGRYNPATDTWRATATNSAPHGRANHTAVWSGSEMIVWGGFDGALRLNTGGRYNPATDTWTATATDGVPNGRANHTAVWSGSEMIVWGGFPTTNTGGRYRPATDSWTATATTNAPDARTLHRAVWTGTEMIIWGGWDTVSAFNTGGRYSPATGTWTASSTANAPDARYLHTGVWTGREMIVWGGLGASGALGTGGRYNPATDTWTATSTNAPDARDSHTAVWTGSEMIVWGGTGGLDTGGRYCASPGGSTTMRPFQ